MKRRDFGCSLFVAVSVIVFAEGLFAASAHASETGFCSAFRAAAAARPREFVSLRGAQQSVTSFRATVRPTANANCRVFRRFYANGLQSQGAMPAKYTCDLPTLDNYGSADLLFSHVASELRACFPDWSFKEETEGAPSTNNETRELIGSTSQAELHFSFADLSFVTHNAKPEIDMSIELDDDQARADSPDLPVVPN